MDIYADLVYSQTGFDVASNFPSACMEVRKITKNSASDGFASNFSGLAQPTGGLLVKLSRARRAASGGQSVTDPPSSMLTTCTHWFKPLDEGAIADGGAAIVNVSGSGGRDRQYVSIGSK